MKKNYIFFTLVSCLVSLPVFSQDFSILTRSDFNLKGEVKTCVVYTDYGEESFLFSEKGLLLESITRFNESDYNKITYKYNNQTLISKVVESYRDKKIDAGVSFKHNYTTLITESTKITEYITNYNNEFIDKFEYYFNPDGELVKVIRQNKSGIEERIIERVKNSNGVVLEESHTIDGIIQKKIKRLEPKAKHNKGDYELLTILYSNGVPEKAMLQAFSKDGLVLFEEDLKISSKTPDKYFSVTKTVYEYNSRGEVIQQKQYKKGTLISANKILYEYDDKKPQNWIVKKDSSTKIKRKIIYY